MQWLIKEGEYQNNKIKPKSDLGVISRTATLAYNINIFFIHLFIIFIGQSTLKLFVEWIYRPVTWLALEHKIKQVIHVAVSYRFHAEQNIRQNKQKH